MATLAFMDIFSPKNPNPTKKVNNNNSEVYYPNIPSFFSNRVGNDFYIKWKKINLKTS